MKDAIKEFLGFLFCGAMGCVVLAGVVVLFGAMLRAGQ